MSPPFARVRETEAKLPPYVLGLDDRPACDASNVNVPIQQLSHGLADWLLRLTERDVRELPQSTDRLNLPAVALGRTPDGLVPLQLVRKLILHESSLDEAWARGYGRRAKCSKRPA
jgi:hypothetical protein